MSKRNQNTQLLMERKLYLAQHNPEPIFDISDCSLKQIPNGIFAVIKVLRKESLHLQNNKLVSLKEGGNIGDLCLLKVLDLSFNNIAKLPPDIKYLTNLQALHIDNNQLTVLPNEIGCLINLHILSVSSNKLSVLPLTIGQLHKLVRLDIRRNNLNSLPSTICRLKSLEELLLDDEREWIAPPTAIVKQRSVCSILSYFAASDTQGSIGAIDQLENGHTEWKTNTSSLRDSDALKNLLKYDQLVQDNLRRLEKEKNDKLLRELNAEKNIIDEREKQAILRLQSQRNTKQFLDTLTAEQRKIDEQVLKCHQIKNEERNKMLAQLQLVESTADSVIAQLIEINRAQKSDNIAAMVESLKSDSFVHHLERQTVLESMEQLLAEECELAKKFEQNDNEKRNIALLSNELETQMRDKLSKLLRERENDKNSLIEDLKRDSELQRTAVLMHIERCDQNNVELRNQIALIENQLSNITALEYRNRNANANNYINELAERRAKLTDLLEELFAQQRNQRRKLMEELVEMEKVHSSQNRKDYWLLQYQKLLDSGGDVILNAVTNLSAALVGQLALHGVSHYAPLLSKLDTASVDSLSAIDDRSLLNLGINSSDDRRTILKSLKQFVWERENAPVRMETPTAPPLESIDVGVAPSAPSQEDVFNGKSTSDDGVLENECVICMHVRSNIVFIRCGHICCCGDCSAKVTKCPLCRRDIERTIRVFIA